VDIEEVVEELIVYVGVNVDEEEGAAELNTRR